MNAWDEIKQSCLWKDAEEVYSGMSLKDKILLYGRIYYPQRTRELTVSDKLDILVRIPDWFSYIEQYLSEKQIAVLEEMMSDKTYEEIAHELRYASRSGVAAAVRSVKAIIMRII